MEKFRMIFQYFQSNSESVMNGICALLALASVKIYTSFDFNCPCLPRYNMMYGMGIMFVPPTIFFLCGMLVNRQTVIMLEEWRRPIGRRKKNFAIVRYMCTSVIQRAMIAPVVWIIVTLLDGKCFICAFSESIDADRFSGFANKTSLEVLILLSKVPCKEDELVKNHTSRKAISRYLRCWSQALGWSILLFLILLAFLARSLKPCFNQTAFLQTRYWSNYIDLEQKVFDETCCEHARGFAHKCIVYFFESMQNEMRLRNFKTKVSEEEEEEEDQIRGITDLDQMNCLLKTWYEDKPPLDISPAARRPHCRSTESVCLGGYSECNGWHFSHEPRKAKHTDV
ncbi:calcium homeostasis modulator protein 3 [Lissotriton helveticus]